MPKVSALRELLHYLELKKVYTVGIIQRLHIRRWMLLVSLSVRSFLASCDNNSSVYNL